MRLRTDLKLYPPDPQSDLTQYTLGLESVAGPVWTSLAHAENWVRLLPTLTGNTNLWARTPCITGECIGGFTHLTSVTGVKGVKGERLGIHTYVPRLSYVCHRCER